MVKKMYKDEISYRIFNNEEDAINSENKNAMYKEIFAPFVVCFDEDVGEKYIQRNAEDYNMFGNLIIKMIKEYEKSYYEYIKIKLEFEDDEFDINILNNEIILNYLNDSDIYDYLMIFCNICNVCYKEYPQLFFKMFVLKIMKMENEINET